MAKKTSAYVDTGALIAFLDRSDTYHTLFVRLFADPPALVTSSLVIAEGHGWFLRRYDTTRALQFMSFIEDLSVMKILPVGQSELAHITKLLQHFSDQRLTLADAAGLWLMKTRKITHCWSTDHHLSLTGATLAIHE